MTETRLYYPPSHTIETLRAVLSGNDTLEKLANELDVSPNTARNKIHDPQHLGLLKRVDETYEVTDEARRLIQLDDKSILEDRFQELPGVQKVLNQIEEKEITAEKIGRIISFETGSGAADEERFREYGQVYVRWIHHLDLGEVDGGTGSKHPLENDKGANNPRVPPQKVIEALRKLSDGDDRSELVGKMDYSERYVQKILTTCYAMDVAKTKPDGLYITDAGRTIITTSKGKQRELFRNKLLKIPLVRAYCSLVPPGEFRNLEIMEQVSEEYNMGWSDSTIRTRAKRLYQWLVFTKLAEEQQQGVLSPTEKMPQEKLTKP